MDALKNAAREKLKALLDQEEIRYSVNEEYNGVIEIEYVMTNQLEEVSISVHCFSDGFRFYSCPQKVEVHPLAYRSLAEFFARVNGHTLTCGHLGIPSESLQPYYMYGVSYAEFNEDPVGALRFAIHTTLSTFNLCGDGIVDVVNGVKTPEDAYNDFLAKEAEENSPEEA